MSPSLAGVGEMTGLRPGRLDDPYADETVRQVSARAPAGLAFFLACVTISTIFEIARFPDRTRTMLGFAAAFVVLAAVCVVLIQRPRAWSLVILVVFVNMIG